MTQKNQPIYVRFHVGRGGYYNNPGHITFCGCENFRGLVDVVIDACDCTLVTEDWDDEKGRVALRDEDWLLINRAGTVLLEGRDEIERETGTIDFDGPYDSDYVKTVDQLTEEEEQILCKDLDTCRYTLMSDELRNYVETQLAPKYSA